MGLAWRVWIRTVAITAAVTSIFWIVLGGWLWHRHLQSDNAVPAAIAGGATTAGVQAPTGKLIIPVAGVRPEQLTDNFAQPREGGARAHEALDIMAPEGTPVKAATAGRVEKLFNSQAGGNTVYQRSPDGTTIYYYAHLSGYAPGLAEGAQLKPGDPVGAVGHTGDADAAAPHLHFAIWRSSPSKHWYDDAPAVNPYPLLGGK
jgi:murein DD-endopeptidase MepM/ murein hydrolase activator NlpD